MSDMEILIVMPTDLKEIVTPYVMKRSMDTGYVYKTVWSDEPIGEKELITALEHSDGYVVNLEKVTRNILESVPRLRAVSKLGVGVDNIDLEAASDNDIEVSNCPGSNSNAVAELSLCFMLNMARNVHKLNNDLKKKIWAPEVGFELRGKCIGLLGFGNVGKQLARYLKQFEVKVLAYDVFENPEYEKEFGIRYVSLEEIAVHADFISIHLPLLPETRHIVNKEFIEKTKKGVFILNMARGGIADEAALHEAVVSGHIAQVATDVFEHEPPFDSPFLTDDRFLVVPHIGAATKEAILTMLDMAIENIKSVLEGRGNRNPVYSKSTSKTLIN